MCKVSVQTYGKDAAKKDYCVVKIHPINTPMVFSHEEMDAIVEAYATYKDNLPKPHIHAESMRLYAEDAAKVSKPWELWEYRFDTDTLTWDSCRDHPAWREGKLYRRKATN